MLDFMSGYPSKLNAVMIIQVDSGLTDFVVHNIIIIRRLSTGHRTRYVKNFLKLFLNDMILHITVFNSCIYIYINICFYIILIKYINYTITLTR